jgi:predicted P-loop ATPase
MADTPYHQAVCEYIWTGLAGRVLDPGCKADMVPILTGKQGLRKSSLVEALAPSPNEYTVVTLADRDDNLARQLRGRMIVEWDELRGLNSREAESLKGWVSRRKDDWIPKFKEFGTSMQRRFLLIGTANPKRFLNDPTGLRRWLPLKITKTIDVDYVLEHRNQLWAEARLMWLVERERTDATTKTGVMWEQAEALAHGAQHDASIRDPWVDAVDAWFVSVEGVGSKCSTKRATCLLHRSISEHRNACAGSWRSCTGKRTWTAVGIHRLPRKIA